MPTHRSGAPSAPHPFELLLNDAGVSRASRIQVTGVSAFATLLWLLRRGYDDVTVVRGQCCSAAGPADVLIVAQTCDADELQALLRHGPHVAPGGLLIVQTLHGSAPFEVFGGEALVPGGLALERRILGAHRDINVARRGEVLARAA
ncbi:MAG TPA: hypothetical protein VFE10_01420 [Phenylobacterium sp.]|jgi:hypothetical protein|nr:hypothetical protein [Phenylobacterium sp.]